MININRSKYIWIAVLLIIILIGISKLLNTTIYDESHTINEQDSGTKENAIIKKSNISERSLEAEETITNAIKYRNDKNLEKLLENYTDRNKKNKFRLDNLEKIELENIKLVTDESQYKNYIINLLLQEGDLEIDQVKIYRVTYNIMYKDESLEPTGNGEESKHYYLIKHKESDKWLINDIGD
ncbi:DUF4829 domain-containing protein [Clostridium sp. DSM 100503]|uniref:DUF4829 domain-containing protein n=1 Tax=Clostridium sp. DSM 100503 TaxID=2963282 RepID=UPI002149F9EE|nr:DUF4829 domain-containing protein [Clostridium sp. DSM 100503]MCR1950579.1 DUF4829 domain-containing protein [Clostridium sp. DSM 100503]